MAHGINGSPRQAPVRRRPDRLHGVVAGIIAVLAVLTGILVVNLLNGSPGPQDSAGPVVAPSRTPQRDALGSATPSASPSARPSRSASPSPSTSPSSPAERSPEPSAAPAASSAPAAGTAQRPAVREPVVVLNNSRVRGLADSAARQVSAAGFPVARTGNYISTYNVEVPTVFYEDAHRGAAEALMAAIPAIKKIVPRSETQIAVPDPLILVITRDFPADP